MGDGIVRSKRSLNALAQFGELNGRRFALLEKIGETGSITHAAKAVGVSYRSAWLTVDHLNTLGEGPLVERIAGGKNGGGTRLTKEGRELLKRYRILREEHDKYLERLRAGMDDFDRFLRLAQRISLKTSARNQLFGKVESIRKEGLGATVVLALPGNEKIVSRITTEGLQGLGLREGDEAFALIKANWIEIVAGRKKSGEEDNRLKGTIAAISRSGASAEITLRFGTGVKLVASAAKGGARVQAMKVGGAATAVFDASNVILGIAL